jgi:hypothetical protein
MKERPILFSAPMVRAILAGTKTQTRRVYKGTPRLDGEHHTNGSGETWTDWGRCPYGKPGDRLWVREAWRVGTKYDTKAPRDLAPRSMTVEYEAGGYACNGLTGGWGTHYPATREYPAWVGKLRPGMFMPRWASRITLEVTGVRVERLQDISEADAIAEGIERICAGRWRCYGDEARAYCISASASYRSLWETINPPRIPLLDADGRRIGMQDNPGRWAANPYVWVVEFKRA